MEDTLNRRGIFFKKLAIADLEFFAARMAGLVNRGAALTINAPVAEAVLPRAAQRRGQWKVELRPYPDGAPQEFDLNRSVDWQLSGYATTQARSLSVGDWFAVQYEVSPNGNVSFLWRVVPLARQHAFWRRIEESVTWHLVARMAHFAEVHPEYGAISALLESASAIEEDEPAEVEAEIFEAEPALEELPVENSIVPSAVPDFSETTLRMSDGAILKYQYYVGRLPVVSVRMRAVVPAPLDEPRPLEDEKPAPAPSIDAMLNLDKAQTPILLREIPAASPKEAPAAPPRETMPLHEPVPSAGGSRWTRTLSASALGLFVLAALNAKNADLSALACEKFRFHCAALQQADIVIPPAPAITAAVPDEPVHTASVPATLPTPAEPAPMVVTKTPSEPAEAGAPASRTDEVVWGFLKDTKDSDQLRNFLSQFPASAYLGLAQTRLAALEPKVTECDLLAAHPLDLLKNPKVTGIKLQFLNTSLATPACERAVEDYPEALRFPLQLGRGYEKAKKYQDAHRWYAKAAALGNVQAMHNLGFQYATGQGVARDYGEARKWFGKAAVLGSTAAMFHLGQLYANGFGVTRDYGEARRWFTQASDNGLPVAMTALGDLYANGFGVERNYGEARQWYRKAAQLGSPEGMYNLGMLQEKGRGGPRDYGEARKWYAKAADIGNEEAKRSLARLKR